MLRRSTDLYQAKLFVPVAAGGLWHRPDVEPHVPVGIAKEPLYGFVNDGRWLVQCPCGGAQLSAPDVDRFFCVDCLNEWCRGLWVQVVWPANHGDIDAALSDRPARNMNWRPGETIEDLRRDNREHGHGVD